MSFRVVARSDAPSLGNEVLLVRDNWNDWYIWVTQFFAIVVREDGSRVHIGHVKIARAGMTRQNAATNLPERFSYLSADWFSMGQTENYYETLNTLGAEYREWFLTSLRDCAYNLNILDQNVDEEVLHSSLLRDIDGERVRNRLHRLANGDAALTAYAFAYIFPEYPGSPDPTPELFFRVRPNSRPPTNVHVLIGRNGVGKSRCFDLLGRTFLGLEAPEGGSAGELRPLTFDPVWLIDQSHGFAGLVTVSFSPFDGYGPLVRTNAELAVRYAYIGLFGDSVRQAGASGQGGSFTIKSRLELTEDFVESVAACRTGARRARWARALRVLEADPLFEEANVSSVADEAIDGWEDRARRLFRNLSSGHSVVLLTITKLIELVEEKSLVLIDEPEGHLHPPLLSAFVRALSDLLTDRNGVAIVATHSPVVLQEVPKECVWILHRSGTSARADRPEAETFGENVGVLTREVFGLEVVQTGFHRMIAEAVASKSYEEVLELFEGRLGGEARGLARALSLIPPGERITEVDEE